MKKIDLNGTWEFKAVDKYRVLPKDITGVAEWMSGPVPGTVSVYRASSMTNLAKPCAPGIDLSRRSGVYGHATPMPRYRALASDSFKQQHPNLTYSMHVWYRTPEAWAKFEGQLDKYGHNTPNDWIERIFALVEELQTYAGFRPICHGRSY